MFNHDDSKIGKSVVRPRLECFAWVVLTCLAANVSMMVAAEQVDDDDPLPLAPTAATAPENLSDGKPNAAATAPSTAVNMPPATAAPATSRPVNYAQLKKRTIPLEKNGLIAVGCNPTCFSPDSTRLLAGSAAGEVFLWSLTDGMVAAQCKGHYGMVVNACFASDGKTVLTSVCDGNVLAQELQPQQQVVGGGKVDNTIRLWDAATGKELRQFGTGEVNRDAQITPDGRYVLGASPDGKLTCWSAATGEIKGTTSGVEMYSVAVMPDSQGALIRDEKGASRMVKLPACTAWRTLTGLPKGNSIARFSPDGKWLFTDGPQNTVVLWDVGNNRIVRQLRGHSAKIICLDVSRNGALLASGSDDKTIRIEDLANCTTKHILSGHTMTVWQVLFTPDGRHLISTSTDNTVRIWDLAEGTEVFKTTLETNLGYLRVRVSPDGTAVLMQAAGRIELWQALPAPAGP